MNQRLDEVLDIFLGQSEKIESLTAIEPLSSENPPNISGPIRALSIQYGEKIVAIIGMTTSNIAITSTGFVTYLSRRGRARKASYLVLTNLRDTQIIKTPYKDEELGKQLHIYPTQHQLYSQDSSKLSPIERIQVIELINHIYRDIEILQNQGQLDMVIPDANFFVDRLTKAVNGLKPQVKQALQSKISMDIDFAKALEKWATPQGIPANLRSKEFAEAVVRQAIYRLLGKIIFYQSLHRAIPDLPIMDPKNLDSGQVIPHLYHCFSEAHKIDYHAVFREDIVDQLPLPAAASIELRDLVVDLNTRDFAHLPQDVIGAVFERLIPPEDRHALGQYFTPEPLVDLITAFCVRDSNDKVLDPTCGTGTFLIRAYDIKQTLYGLHNHSKQLSDIWGVDIAPFPAELATINLFRQEIRKARNFPRILNDDFFNIHPGGKYRFPPLKEESKDLDDGSNDEEIPQFDAIVGNFPYINAANIEKREKGYLEKVDQILVDEWLETFPEGFHFKKVAEQKEFQRVITNGLDISRFKLNANPIISSFADLYVSLYWHSTAFLQAGGRMGIITSNAWLDVNYGFALQKFILEKFKIIAILESRSEPWFEQAAVNTVVTILERCDNREEREENTVHFVKIKKKLNDLIPWDMHIDSLSRWLGIKKITQTIEALSDSTSNLSDPISQDNKDFRVRGVSQGSLYTYLNRIGQTDKWGAYLRAPQVYFDILNTANEKITLLKEIAPPSFGSKTGNNTFYHFNDEKINKEHIESRFLFPLLKSPGDTDQILLDPEELKLKVFICRKTKEELQSEGFHKVLEYIEWGENQVFTSGSQEGLTWPHGAEVRNRKPGWYALPFYRSKPGQIFFPQAFGERHITKYCQTPIIADARLYFLSPIEGISHELIAAVMNSSIVSLFTEIMGRVTLGDGALELKVEDAREYLLIPDVRKFAPSDIKTIVNAFQPLLIRPIGNVFEEVEKPDRQELDKAILNAMGLKPENWLQPIYNGLTQLVSERTQLAKMRNQSQKSKPQKAAKRVFEEVIEEVLPHGPKTFPEDFLSEKVKRGKFHEIALPDSPLTIQRSFFGKEELITESNEKVVVSNPNEADYVKFAQSNGQVIARLPEQPVEVSRAVKDYRKYLLDLQDLLQDAFFIRTLDQNASERYLKQAWKQFNLPKTSRG